MRCAIFVNSLLGLITAVQIRTHIYKDCRFDLFISDMMPALKKVYKNKLLEEKFDNIRFISYENISQLNKLLYVISPEKYVRKLLGYDFEDYSDVFFWNPTFLLHGCLFQLRKRNVNFKLHLYGDAIGSYVTEYPFETKMFNNAILDSILKFRKHHILVKNMDYDYYVFGKEYVSFNASKEIIDIPRVRQQDIEYYTRLFDCNNINPVKEKVVFMDKQHSDEFSDDDKALEILKAVSDYVGYDNFVVKPHPRQDLTIYERDNIKTLNMDLPWEAYCFCNNIEDKIIVSYGSSALFMPYILMNEIKYISICININNNFNTIFRDEFNMFMNKLIENKKRLYVINSEAELPQVVKKIVNMGNNENG